MKSNYKPLGDFIRLVDNRNKDKVVKLLRGISTSKQFIESKANMTGVDISKYKIVEIGQFAYVSDTSRRGEKIALAMNERESFIVSSIYTVFEIKDENKLLPEYMFLWFNRSEFDRYARFHSWGSARETFNWSDMCNVMIPIPSINEQQKYVDLYKALSKNQRCYELTLNDLQVISNSYIDNLIRTNNKKRLGAYIKKSDVKNSDLKVGLLRGISTSKRLIKSKANTTGVSFSGYRIVKNGQFAYVPDTSRRGDKIALAMNNSEPCIVSSIYTVFEVTDTSVLLPEYLYLWFSRTEFDRYARFHSWGSARETFDWSDMCDVHLPMPSIEEQLAIVAIHHTLETRKAINEKLKEAIKPLCSVLMRGVVQQLEQHVTEAA